MIVDDEEPILHSTALLLRSLGYQTVGTGDARRIIPLVLSERPDVLLQDVRMPGLDVGQMLADLRDQGEAGSIPVILFSASISLGDLGQEVGAAVLEKPFRPAQLVEAIESALAAAARQRAGARAEETVILRTTPGSP